MRVLSTTLPNGKQKHCDSRCHNSAKRSCNCICKGLLHGKGNRYAKYNAAGAQYYIARSYPNDPKVFLRVELVPAYGG